MRAQKLFQVTLESKIGGGLFNVDKVLSSLFLCMIAACMSRKRLFYKVSMNKIQVDSNIVKKWNG